MLAYLAFKRGRWYETWSLDPRPDAWRGERSPLLFVSPALPRSSLLTRLPRGWTAQRENASKDCCFASARPASVSLPAGHGRSIHLPATCRPPGGHLTALTSKTPPVKVPTCLTT